MKNNKHGWMWLIIGAVMLSSLFQPKKSETDVTTYEKVVTETYTVRSDNDCSSFTNFTGC